MYLNASFSKKMDGSVYLARMAYIYGGYATIWEKYFTYIDIYLDMPSTMILDSAICCCHLYGVHFCKILRMSLHVWLFNCFNYSGAGAHLFRSWATYLNRSIILTPEVL